MSADPGFLETEARTGEDYHPRPRYAPKCASCGRFVAKATVRTRGNVSTGEVVQIGNCSRCGQEEVW